MVGCESLYRFTEVDPAVRHRDEMIVVFDGVTVQTPEDELADRLHAGSQVDLCFSSFDIEAEEPRHICLYRIAECI